MGEIIALDLAARKKILAGAELVAKSLRGEAVVCRKGGLVRVIRDPREILEALFSPDPLEMIAIRLIRENALSSYGASLVAELLREGLEALSQGKSVAEIKAVLNQREERPYHTTLHLERGYLSPYFVNRPETMQCELAQPYLYIAPNKLCEPLEIVPILEAHPGPLLILAEEVSGDVLTTLVINCVKRALPVAAIAVSKQGRLLLESGPIERALIEKERATLVGVALHNVVRNSVSMTLALLSMDSVVIVAPAS